MIEPPPVRETTVDGVAALWVDTPPPYTAMLMFRVGMWDETARTRGITHLVEHLALFGRRDVQHAFNGVVDGDTTTLWASGRPEEVHAFLREVASSLRSLPLDRLETEADILRAEAAGRGGSTLDVVLRVLFGPNGPGLSGVQEWGLHDLDAAVVQQWSHRHFTRSNAVLLCDGPPPRDLGLDLLTGKHRISRLPRRDVGYRPTGVEVVGYQSSGVCLGALVPRSVAARTAVHVLGRRLTASLRHAQGLAYSIAPIYLPLDATTALVFFGADAQPERRADLGRAFIDVFDQFATAGLTADERASMEQVIPDTAHVDAAGLARSELLRQGAARLKGEPALSLEDLAAMGRDLGPDDVVDVIRLALREALVVAPPGTDLGLAPMRRFSDAPLGTVSFPFRRSRTGADSELRLGEDGVSVREYGSWTSIEWTRLALAVEDAEGAWWFLSDTGASLSLDPATYRREEELRALLAAHIPPAMKVEASHSAPVMAPPTGSESVAPRPAKATASIFDFETLFPPEGERLVTNWLPRAFIVGVLYLFGISLILLAIEPFSEGDVEATLAAAGLGVVFTASGEVARRVLFRRR